MRKVSGFVYALERVSSFNIKIYCNSICVCVCIVPGRRRLLRRCDVRCCVTVCLCVYTQKCARMN